MNIIAGRYGKGSGQFCADLILFLGGELQVAFFSGKNVFEGQILGK